MSEHRPPARAGETALSPERKSAPPGVPKEGARGGTPGSPTLTFGTNPAQRRDPVRGIIGGMEEARRVLARLERIEALDRERAVPGVLLTELRALLVEAEAWARAERAVPEPTLETVERCRLMLEDASRTLLA